MEVPRIHGSEVAPPPGAQLVGLLIPRLGVLQARSFRDPPRGAPQPTVPETRVAPTEGPPLPPPKMGLGSLVMPAPPRQMMKVASPGVPLAPSLKAPPPPPAPREAELARSPRPPRATSPAATQPATLGETPLERRTGTSLKPLGTAHLEKMMLPPPRASLQEALPIISPTEPQPVPRWPPRLTLEVPQCPPPTSSSCWPAACSWLGSCNAFPRSSASSG